MWLRKIQFRKSKYLISEYRGFCSQGKPTNKVESETVESVHQKQPTPHQDTEHEEQQDHQESQSSSKSRDDSRYLYLYGLAFVSFLGIQIKSTFRRAPLIIKSNRSFGEVH